MKTLKARLALLAAVVLAGTSLCSCNGTTDPADGGNEGGETTTAKATEAGETTTVNPTPEAVTSEQGKVFNIYAWNEEYKGFFEKYYAGTKPVNDKAVADEGAEPIYYDKAPGIPEGVTVNWIINPSDGGVYQEKLDEALLNQASASADDKIDMFLAEADYIVKYTDTDLTMDIADIGLGQVDTEYQYTVDAASSSDGKIKGVSFQCCPAALIYRRSIAKDVLGSDDPATVQEALNSWEKFEAVAADAKAKGYYMTASYVETYRTFSNNTTSAWVNDNMNLVVDKALTDYLDQAEKFMANEYTLPAGVWDDEKNQQMFKDGKTMCFFGPAWYYNFSMGNAQDPEKGCSGDWAICEGPQAYFWGGTWLLAATGTDNGEMLKSIFESFTVNEDICSALIENEGQFTNNSKVNEKYANDPEFGNAFLGGQNDTAIYVELAKNIKFENKTIYDQLLNENLPSSFLDFFKGTITKEEAYANFYKYVNEKYPDIVTPAA